MQSNSINFETILITGGTGMLGSYLARFLVKKGMRISILKRPSSSLKRLEGVEDDIEFYNSFEELQGKSFDAIFHLRTTYGSTSVKKLDNILSKSEILKVNHDEPLELLSFIELQEQTVLFNFNTSLNEDVNDYAFSKHQFVKSVKREFPKLKMVNFLLEQFYAPCDERLIGFLFNSFLTSKQPIKLTNGMQRRDFIYYKDVLCAVECSMLNLDFGSLKTMDIPLGSGEALSIRAVVEMVQIITGKNDTHLEWGAIDIRENEPEILMADLKILKSLGFRINYSLREGLEEVFESCSSRNEHE